MSPDTAPFFVQPYRMDAPEDGSSPRLGWRRELVLEPGERVVWRGLAEIAGYLLRPRCVDRERVWALPRAAEVAVTDRRLAYVCAGWTLAAAEPIPGGPRHRRQEPSARIATGQVRWQWPSRLHVLPPSVEADRPGQLMLVSDSLRTIRQPALALSSGDLTDGDARLGLAHLIRRAVARFRLADPSVTDLSPPERDALRARTHAAGFAAELIDPRGVDLPGSLPVEFLHRDDYYRRAEPGERTGRLAEIAGWPTADGLATPAAGPQPWSSAAPG
ncbi:hypothetical protein [Plantactinospora sp. KBS50]|uniref:hypothetical protein n=1 Tax=Plantactinospora sp. KBS50 TaxID=2024580 RepID=UPI001E600777|nr:hypothetical protein [Plantactinospora sp. KBS50]